MELITTMVETPKGSAQKYDYDEDLKLFKLKKVMPAGMVFPFDFGFIPNTKGGDGDPLDVIIISELKSFTGCVVDCRIIGGIAAEQTEKGKTMRNDRFYAIPEVSQMFTDVYSLNDLPKNSIGQLEEFFINYNKLAGKEFKPIEKLDAKKAYQLIMDDKTNG